jgi:antitoxin ParD1/3/4
MANVSLTKHQEQFIQKKVKSGRYLSTSEVVREGLRLLEEEDHLRTERLKVLRGDIAVATRQLKEGKVVDGAAAFRKARKRVQKRSVAS